MENHENEQKIRALYNTLLKSWNTKSASGFGNLFAEDGNAIGFDGSPMNGWKEIIDELSKVFTHHETALYVSIVKEVRALGADVYMLRAVAGMVPRGRTEINPEVNAIQTLIAQKKGREFRIALFQNTPAAFHGRKELIDQLTKELQEVFDTSHIE